jgi:glycosyltransferase involved in cell wall biosynthesis
MRLAVVIPAYQEAATLRGIVQRTLAHCRDVYVIDDGSTDGTGASVADLPVHFMRHAHNEGKAASLWDGFTAALSDGADLVVTLDADGQHRPEDIPRIVAASRQHPDRIVIAARVRNRGAAPRTRRIANAIADFGVSWAAGHPIVDSQSGQRAYPAALLRLLSGDASLRRGRAAGFALESELLVAAAEHGYATAAVPIDTVYFGAGRRSHFLPLRDIGRIARMLVRRLMARGLNPRGLWRYATQRPLLAEDLQEPIPRPADGVADTASRQG